MNLISDKNDFYMRRSKNNRRKNNNNEQKSAIDIEIENIEMQIQSGIAENIDDLIETKNKLIQMKAFERNTWL